MHRRLALPSGQGGSAWNAAAVERARGVSVARPVGSASWAWWREVPCMEPDVSLTNTVSRGRGAMAAFSAAVGCGGITIRSV